MFESAIPAYARQQRDGDWACPNPQCMNHNAGVFGTKMSCPVCGSPRPMGRAHFGRMGGAPPPPPNGMVRYGHVDNFSKLMRACAPGPYLPQPDAVTDDGGEHAGHSESSHGGDWLCKCTAVNPRSRKRCGTCGAKMDEVQLEQSAMEWDDLCKMLQKGKRNKRSRSRSRKRKKKRRKSSSSSSSSSSEASRKKSKRRRSHSRSGSPVQVELSDTEKADNSERQAAPKTNPEIEQAKSEVLKKIMSLKEAALETQERNRQWRALLREWHPDKHENKDLATAVFQFLQKAKSLIHSESK